MSPAHAVCSRLAPFPSLTLLARGRHGFWYWHIAWGGRSPAQERRAAGQDI